MSILEQFLAEAGITPASVGKNTVAGKFFAAEGVKDGPEFRRIKKLPRRDWSTNPDLSVGTRLLSRKLRKPGSTAPDLFPVQAAALAEAHDYRRLFLVASMGCGKTLISALLPTVLKAKRPVLMTYASLLESPHGPGKTQREFQRYAEDWNVAQNYQFLSFEKFSRKEYATWLDKHEPDLIVWDESHAGKNLKSGRARRLQKYLKKHPECMFMPMTGTPGDKSIADYAHLLAWSLGESNCPVPCEYIEFVQWCSALDVDVDGIRTQPGVLAEFSSGDLSLEAVRAGVGRRIQETPGVIYSRTGSCDCSLYLKNVIYDGPCEVLEYVRKSGDELPDGRVLETPLERWLLFETLNLGFVRVIDPPPPKPWREARKEWSGFVSDAIGKPRSPYETPDQVKDACLAGELDSFGLLEAWLEIKPTFTPVSRVEWFDSLGVEFIASQMRDNVLVWVPFPALAQKLSEYTGVPYFHQRGFSSEGKYIEDHDGPAILSVKANATGRNLQKWSKNLIMGTPGTSDLLCQLIARTHRTGQTAEAVEVTFLMASIENFESVYRARARAEHDRTVGGNQASALLTGDWLVYSFEDISSMSGARWRK